MMATFGAFFVGLNVRGVAGPGPERGSSEGVGAAGVRQGRAHFRDRIGEAEIHKGDENGAEEHAAPAADGEAKVPAGEFARNDGGDAERPQIEDAGVAPELPVLEIAYVDVTVGNATFLSLVGHYALVSPSSRATGRDANLEGTITWKGLVRDTSPATTLAMLLHSSR